MAKSNSRLKIGTLVTTPNIVASVSDPTITTVSKIFEANNSILVKNIDADVTFTAGDYLILNNRSLVGAIRIASEVIWYDRVWEANSTLTGLTRNVGGTRNSTINGNLVPDSCNIISVLGLR